jgi:aminoglycoside phosphotransferase (APT) family kinase protein
MTAEPQIARDGAPAADLEIDAPLVRALLAEQHPDLASMPIALAAGGWDNEMFRLGGDLCVRLPRRAVAASLLLNEQRWLPLLSKTLPLPVPAPLRFGRPNAAYPWSWSVVPWLDGSPADLAELGPGETLPLMRFLRALHCAAPADAPRNPVRGCALADRAAALEARASRVQARTTLFTGTVRALWEQALSAPIDVEPSWIHGDLHPRNILVERGKLSAVIDWGDMASGDRAVDLACIWMLLPDARRRRQAMESYSPVSAHTWSRARGWAILLGTVFADTGLNGDARFMAIGERTLRRVAEDP